jgi:hypothetical protein
MSLILGSTREKRMRVIGLVLFLLAGPFYSIAATSSQPQATSSNKIINTILPVLPSGAQEAVKNAEDTKNGVQGVWDKSNAWLQSHVGLSLKQIINAIGKVIIWVLSFAVQVIQSVIRSIQFVLSYIG